MILKYIYHRTDEYDRVIFEGYYVANSVLHAYKIPANFIHIRPLQWRHNGRDSISNHQPDECLLNHYSDADQRKHQSSASLAFVRRIHRGPVNFPHKWPVTRKMFPFDDVIMRATLMRAGISTVTTGHQNKITTATAIPASQHVQGELYLTSFWNLNSTIIVFTDDAIQK